MRVLLTGASGQLGSYIVRELIRSGHRAVLWSRGSGGRRYDLELCRVDLTDAAGILAGLTASDPEVIIHAAAMATAEDVRNQPVMGWAVNVEGTRLLTGWCRDRGRRLVFTSTDLVFDGTRPWYREEDNPNPIMDYGRTKAEAEEYVLDSPGGLVARLSLLYGASSSGRQSFIDRALAALRAGTTQVFFEDEFRTPLDYGTAARALVRLAECDYPGILHVAGQERVSRFELMRRVAAALDIDRSLVRANRRQDVVFAERRPADVSLDTSRLAALLPDLPRPSIEEAVLRA
jgi:dTDP-4-dehydrorhamnose reductase